MQRKLGYIAIISTMLLIAACQPAAPTSGGATTAESTPTEAVQATVEATPTVEETPTAEATSAVVTSTEETTSTQEVTGSQETTSTDQATPTEEATTTEAVTSTGTTSGTAAVNTVEVELVSFAIHMPTSIPAGPTEFKVTNNGDTTHSFTIEGQGIDQTLAASLEPGKSATLDVNLTAGDYEAYCPIDDHKGMGMDVKLTVTGQ